VVAPAELSPNTLTPHRQSIYRRLGVSNRDELLARVAEADPAPRDTTDVSPG
jgi:DNA-binding CsgD family transcriptional regulator